MRDAKAGAVIDYAKRIKNWPSLEIAIDKKMEDQTEFVRWWDENVRRRGEKSNSTEQRYLVVDAEDLTGISHQQVSKWRRRLKDPEKYKAMLYGASYRKAMAETMDQRGASGTGENEWYTFDGCPQETYRGPLKDRTRGVPSLFGNRGSQSIGLDRLLDSRDRDLDVGHHRQEPGIKFSLFRPLCQKKKGLASENQKPVAERREAGHSVAAPFCRRCISLMNAPHAPRFQ